MQRALTAALGVATIALPVSNAVAAVKESAASVTRKTVVTRKVLGSAVEADRWGTVQVSVTVKKTTVITNGVKKVTRKWTDIGGTFTYHTDRSLYIMQQSLPQLRTQALQSHSASVDTISGATYSSDAFTHSLQEALAKVNTV